MFGRQPATEEEKKALKLLKQGNPQEAFQAMRFIIEYPGKLSDEKKWKSAWLTFSKIAAVISGEDLKDISKLAAESSNDPKTLYNFGYALVEEGLFHAAATALERAHKLMPDMGPIISEFAVALENIGFNDKAFEVLKDFKEVSTIFVPLYQLVFNALMSARIEEAREFSKKLPELITGNKEERENMQFMLQSIEDMLSRADSLGGICTLDYQDLRGWTYVVNASLLLHVSPHGFDDGMNGRYCYLYESADLLKECLKRLDFALNEMDYQPRKFFVMPDRDSQILARIAGKFLGYEIIDWNPAEDQGRGILLCYSLEGISEEIFEDLMNIDQNLLFWCHACNWTASFPLAPDIISYFYQYAKAPWGESMKLDEENKGVKMEPGLEGSVEEITEIILGQFGEIEKMTDLDILSPFAKKVYINSKTADFQRVPFRKDSPVKSNEFR